jgi:hypothetical protein
MSGGLGAAYGLRADTIAACQNDPLEGNAGLEVGCIVFASLLATGFANEMLRNKSVAGLL